MANKFDAIIIGSGQAGGPLATALVAAGRETALIERDQIGGTCINYGCTPTKTMIASAESAYMAGRSLDYGVRTNPVDVDMSTVRRRKRDMVENFRAHSLEAIKKGGVEVVIGTASFTSPDQINVELKSGSSRSMESELIVIDTGSSPSEPPISGLDMMPHFNSTTIMDLDAVPEHLLILGGSYIAIEFGQMFRRFGSQVTMVEMAPQLLAHEDEDIAHAVTSILMEDGIEILTAARATQVESGGEGSVKLTVEKDGKTRAIEGTHLLVATGRRPNSKALRLEAAGVETNDKGFIVVDERLRTSAPNIYAVGEVAGSPPFTHIAYDDFRILRDNLLHGKERTTSGRMIPYTVFMDPQLGRVGITERNARSLGLDIKVATLPMTSVARAIETSQTRGFMKAVVDANSEQILGFAALSIEGGEIMAMIEIAMMGKLPYTAFEDAIFSHPTLAEGLNSLFSNLA